ncbi:MAG: RHS repeat-associated core domain-containing protein [Marinagarivorans sp.]|nr:RHS repeat-associated core domain-containing protein [Marinagarivorans sp.]
MRNISYLNKMLTPSVVGLDDEGDVIVGETAKLHSAIFIGTLYLMSSAVNAVVTEEITYIHTDVTGSVKAATNSSGKLLWRQVYHPYGEERIDTGQRVGMNQRERDADSGLVYMGARYYDPLIGRFLSPDPVSVLASAENNPMMINRYAYGNNNPLTFHDPDGRSPLAMQGVIQDNNQNYLRNSDPAGYAQAERVVGDVLSIFVGPPAFGVAVKGGVAAFKSFKATSNVAKEIGILREAAKGKGNFGLGSGTRSEADELGKAWVGDGHTNE